ncbi:hypothetical protein H0H92_011987 [Tricholoma furcatifolium]|nr:hypothetical protein H0H92_011987 [Tricholoma furcatifolium]
MLIYYRFMFYFDDFPSPSDEKFQLFLLSSDDIHEPVFVAFRSLFRDLYQVWETIPANGIVVGALEVLNGRFLEDIHALRGMQIAAHAQAWPEYLRQKTGGSAAYAYMIFLQTDVTDFIQAMGDIAIYMDLANDILSLYKEEMAGETQNYVHNRARSRGKSCLETLTEMAREAGDAYYRASAILLSRSPAAFELWTTFVSGYILFQIAVPRYRLRELGFEAQRLRTGN